ncbi:hypothetical protein PHMEG_00018491 [Phytophthora megakarya]|uniref:Uncharacterized protein n=1 Tax=Phytophthora megakarya TaxID=4795 RepID=A0A225VUS2_9STRA|nr:hypothetical protein PHMEG_00018491 [Phytophthora megakarya]
MPKRSLGEKQQLFVGNDSKDRFGRILRRVIKSLSKEEMCELSCTPEDIVCAKVAVHTRSVKSIDSPQYPCICEWVQSLGKLKDRYINFGEGADRV